jgi:mono/diheme cytochrome c family protein
VKSPTTTFPDIWKTALAVRLRSSVIRFQREFPCRSAAPQVNEIGIRTGHSDCHELTANDCRRIDENICLAESIAFHRYPSLVEQASCRNPSSERFAIHRSVKDSDMTFFPRNCARLLALLPAILLVGCDKPAPLAEAATLVTLVAAAETPLPEEISFNEHIQPILSENCYACHGPDSGSRKPDKEPLRLDLADEAFKPRESGTPVIVKGKPAESELIGLIKSTDEDQVMPPPGSHKSLKPREIALL